MAGTIHVVNPGGPVHKITDHIETVDEALAHFFGTRPRPADFAVQIDGQRIDDYSLAVRPGDVIIVLEDADSIAKAVSGA